EDRASQKPVARVAPRASPRHLEQARREERVTRQVEEVRKRHIGSRDTKEDVPVPHEVARDPTTEREADPQPRPTAGVVTPSHDEPYREDGRRRHDVFDEPDPPLVEPGPTDRIQDQRGGADPPKGLTPAPPHTGSSTR